MVPNVKQVGCNPRFLENMVVCHSKKLIKHPRKKCRELYHISLQGKCNSLTQIRLFCFWRRYNRTRCIDVHRFFCKILILESLRKKYLLYFVSLRLHFGKKSFVQIWLKIFSFSRKKNVKTQFVAMQWPTAWQLICTKQVWTLQL